MLRNGFMMKLLLIAALGVFAAFAWLSLPKPPRPQGEQAGHAHAGGAAVLADGVVLSVDHTASRITISHGPLYNLGMPPMTMAFQVGDPALLDQVNAGDKVKFHADVAASGAFTVTRIERAPQTEYEISPQFLDGIASRDDLCFGAFAGDKLVSYCFFAVMPTDIDGYLRFHFPQRWIYVYKAFTHPAWRGRRLQQQVFLRALPGVSGWLSGLRQPAGFVTLAMTDNAPSLSAFARLGFTPFESFRVLRVRSRPRLLSPSEGEPADFYIEVVAKDQRA